MSETLTAAVETVVQLLHSGELFARRRDQQVGANFDVVMIVQILRAIVSVATLGLSADGVPNAMAGLPLAPHLRLPGAGRPLMRESLAGREQGLTEC